MISGTCRWRPSPSPARRRWFDIEALDLSRIESFWSR
jgi:hypothetical protein